ncbi:hypothetical protein AURDEDRAFT_167377 [Auricularia subglabra TFB-10046 SS5]|nr:hypothetical protein AURDEDRAFT_167377 [Auricularia subglabra TFB-10046 SS5]
MTLHSYMTVLEHSAREFVTQPATHVPDHLGEDGTALGGPGTLSTRHHDELAPSSRSRNAPARPRSLHRTAPSPPYSCQHGQGGSYCHSTEPLAALRVLDEAYFIGIALSDADVAFARADGVRRAGRLARHLRRRIMQCVGEPGTDDLFCEVQPRPYPYRGRADDRLDEDTERVDTRSIEDIALETSSNLVDDFGVGG